MTETLAQARARAKSLYDDGFAILAKYGGRITDETTDEDRAALQQKRGLLDEVETLMARLVADDADADRFTKGHDEYSRPAELHRQPSNGHAVSPWSASIGDGVVRSSEYKAARESGQFNTSFPRLAVPVPTGISLVQAAKRVGLEHRTLITSNDASGGGFVIADRIPEPATLARQELAWLDALPTRTTTSDLVEWLEQTTRTNNAAPVAEATATTGTSGLKPESALAYQLVSKPVETIATWVPATTRILADAAQLRALIDDDLLYMVREELEEQTVIGTGASPQLLGVNVVSGTQTLAAGSFANAADAIFAAAMAVRFTGGLPATAVGAGPATFQALRLLRENAATGTLGGYLFGPPNQPGPMTIFGMDVLPMQAAPANTAFVLNMTAATIVLVVRQGGTIETGWINDQFVRNMLTIRAELRAVLAVKRPKAICKVTGLP